ncbi:MAG: flagellar export protein FliJ [Nitrosomonadales bacterium]|nr:flagellar export protein FliJ [Nitrosomonadales bacterium]
MTKPFPLQPLVHLAHQKNDAATRKFGKLNQQQQAAQARLETLLQYRRDYQAQFQEAVQTGMGQTDLRNFQNFILRLDEAIAQQRETVERALSSMQAGRDELEDTQRKMKSFDTLAQRHAESEKKLAAKSEQRLQDEHTGRHATFKATSAQNES